MITNLIYYLYGIKVECLRKIKDKYVFFINGYFYIFKECFIDEEYINRYYSFIDDGLFHKIIKNKKNKYISIYSNHSYILLLVRVNGNRKIVFNDLFNNVVISYSKKELFNWIYLWKDKIDQVEYVVNSNDNIFSISNLTIINYYLGLSEIAINIINDKLNSNDIIPLSICRNRLKSDFDLFDYYDITDLCIDNLSRDLGEYVKSDIVNNRFDLKKYIFINNLDRVDKVLFLARVIFPSYFYDIFDDFILNNRDFKEFDHYFIRINEYEKNIESLVGILTK